MRASRTFKLRFRNRWYRAFEAWDTRTRRGIFSASGPSNLFVVLQSIVIRLSYVSSIVRTTDGPVVGSTVGRYRIERVLIDKPSLHELEARDCILLVRASDLLRRWEGSGIVVRPYLVRSSDVITDIFCCPSRLGSPSKLGKKSWTLPRHPSDLETWSSRSRRRADLHLRNG